MSDKNFPILLMINAGVWFLVGSRLFELLSK